MRLTCVKKRKMLTTFVKSHAKLMMSSRWIKFCSQSFVYEAHTANIHSKFINVPARHRRHHRKLNFTRTKKIFKDFFFVMAIKSVKSAVNECEV